MLHTCLALVQGSVFRLVSWTFEIQLLLAVHMQHVACLLLPLAVQFVRTACCEVM